MPEKMTEGRAARERGPLRDQLAELLRAVQRCEAMWALEDRIDRSSQPRLLRRCAQRLSSVVDGRRVGYLVPLAVALPQFARSFLLTMGEGRRSHGKLACASAAPRQERIPRPETGPDRVVHQIPDPLV